MSCTMNKLHLVLLACFLSIRITIEPDISHPMNSVLGFSSIIKVGNGNGIE